MSTSSRGASRERQVRKLLEDEGWAVTKAAGSHGCADLWATKNARVWFPFLQNDGVIKDTALALLRLVQVKGNKGSPWKDFVPKDRDALAALAVQAGGTAELWHWPPNKPCKVYLESEWPPCV